MGYVQAVTNNIIENKNTSVTLCKLFGLIFALSIIFIATCNRKTTTNSQTTHYMASCHNRLNYRLQEKQVNRKISHTLPCQLTPHKRVGLDCVVFYVPANTV